MPFDFSTFGTTPQTTLKPSKGSFDFNSFGNSVTPASQVPKKNFGQKAAGFLGVEKFAQGIGQSIANKEGIQDKLIALHDQGLALTEKLQELIKSNKASGKDTSRLQKALDNQLKQNSDFINTINEVGSGGLTNKEVLGSALNTATLFAPGAGKGASFEARVLSGAGTGYAFDVAKNLQENKNGAKIFEPGLGTAVGITLPMITSIFGKGAKLEQINERLTPTEKKNLGQKGKEVAQYITDKRIVGTPEQRLNKIDTLYQNMESKVQEVVNNSKVSYPKQPVITALQDVKKQFLNSPSEYKSVSNKIDDVIGFLQEHAKESIPAGVLNDYKRDLASAAYNEKGNKVLSEGLKAASDTLYSFLKDTIPGLKPLNSEYSKIITAKSLLNSAVGRNQAGLFARASGMAAGAGIGASMGGSLGAGVGSYIGQGVVNNLATPLRSTLGVGLNEIQKLINAIPTDKVGNLKITQKALIKLISGH